jgi:GT2 family glycosyltransferase
MIDITIAIVTFNNERTIKKCIESILSHMDGKLEYKFYIIDNNSTDNTLSIIRSISDKIIILKNTKNIGFGAGHNKVIEMLDSRYHLAVNPDIVIENNCISEMTDYMDKNTDIGLLSPMIKFPDGRIQYLCKRNPTFFDLFIRFLMPMFFKKRQDYFEMKETGYNQEFEIEYATGCFMFFRTDIFKKLNGFDEHFFLYLEDADITRRVNEISVTVFYPYNHVIHEWQRGTHKVLKLMWIDVQSAAYYFRKWRLKI